MAKYRVRRHFPAHIPMRVGQELEDPKFRNLELLVKQGYLEEIEGRMLGSGKTAEAVEKPIAEIVEPEMTEPIVADPKPVTKPASKKSKEQIDHGR